MDYIDTVDIDGLSMSVENVEMLDQPVKSDKWKALFFTKSGQSYIGRITDNSQEATIKRVDGIIKYMESTSNPGLCTWELHGITIYHKSFSHYIPIPIK